MNLPTEMKVTEYNSCTLEMDNGRGSMRLLDIYMDKSEHLLSLDLNAVNGSLDIIAGKSQYKLSEYQVRTLIEFLQQRD